MWRMELCAGAPALRGLLQMEGPAARILAPARRAWDIHQRATGQGSDFDLSLRLLRSACQDCVGVLRLSRVSGCYTGSASPPLRDADGASGEALGAFAQALGPDELWVTLEGAEVHALPAVHLGECVYELPYLVTLPGPYRLSALLLRGNFSSLDEVTYADSSPPLHLDSIAGDRLLLQLGSAAPADQEAVRAAILDAPASEARLPACSSNGSAGEGRFVRTLATTLDTFAPPAPPFVAPHWPEGTRPFAYYVRLGEEFIFLPYACRRPAFDAQRTAERCIIGRAMDLRGDSQTRTLFNHAMARICGVPGAALKGIFEDQCVDADTPNNAVCGQDGGRVCMTWDSMGEAMAGAEHRFDLVATNFGQWPASEYRVPAVTYQAWVAAYWSAWDREGGALPQRAQRMLWMETQPLCWTTAREWKGDWRTHHRIMLYEEAARGAMGGLLRSGVLSIVGLWRLSLPLVMLCPDGAHMASVDSAMDALLWALLDAVCPGWAEDGREEEGGGPLGALG